MGSFAASVANFSAKAKANLRDVIFGAIEDLFELATRRQASITETGTFKEGFVPVDTGFLVGSARLTLNGSIAGVGTVAGKNSAPPDFAMLLLNADIGDTASLQFTAEYAQRLEYGFSGTDAAGRTYNMPGRFFVRSAVIQWQVLIDENARYIGEP